MRSGSLSSSLSNDHSYSIITEKLPILNPPHIEFRLLSSLMAPSLLSYGTFASQILCSFLLATEDGSETGTRRTQRIDSWKKKKKIGSWKSSSCPSLSFMAVRHMNLPLQLSLWSGRTSPVFSTSHFVFESFGLSLWLPRMPDLPPSFHGMDGRLKEDVCNH